MPAANDIRKGQVIKFNNEPHLVMETQHRTPGNLRAFVQIKMRNLRYGKALDQRFASTDHSYTASDIQCLAATNSFNTTADLQRLAAATILFYYAADTSVCIYYPSCVASYCPSKSDERISVFERTCTTTTNSADKQYFCWQVKS